MTVAWYGRCGLWLFGLAIPAAHAALTPQQLMDRMQQAAQTLTYDGVFVYHHDDHLESLRILHKVEKNGVRERLVSLNGVPREIIRTNSEVLCYLPDENSVMVEHRRADPHSFPALLPDTLAGIANHYKLSMGHGGRVAGRKIQSVRVQPRDAYRFGYQLWADQDTGLLLKASLLDEHGSVIEQYMFTHITIGGAIAESDLNPQNRGRGLVWHRPEPGTSAPSTHRWAVTQLPAGFVQTEDMSRHLPNHRLPVEHLVFSDGLAVVSVFIEPVSDVTESARITGPTRIGAMHAYGRTVADHQITVVGEVPAATVNMIGESVSLKP